jgi:hypothetical protein
MLLALDPALTMSRVKIFGLVATLAPTFCHVDECKLFCNLCS